MSTGIYKC